MFAEHGCLHKFIILKGHRMGLRTRIYVFVSLSFFMPFLVDSPLRSDSTFRMKSWFLDLHTLSPAAQTNTYKHRIAIRIAGVFKEEWINEMQVMRSCSRRMSHAKRTPAKKARRSAVSPYRSCAPAFGLHPSGVGFSSCVVEKIS